MTLKGYLLTNVDQTYLRKMMRQKKENLTISRRLNNLELANKKTEELEHELRKQTIKMDTWKC